jgi:hypothetical protein
MKQRRAVLSLESPPKEARRSTLLESTELIEGEGHYDVIGRVGLRADYMPRNSLLIT